MNEFYQNNYYEPQKEKPKKGISTPIFIAVICLVLVLSIVFTATITTIVLGSAYQKKIDALNERIELLTANYDDDLLDSLSLISKLVEAYSYYAYDLSEDELMTAVLKAYMEATGDDYAEYYTKEEHDELVAESNGDFVGIGVSVLQDTMTINSIEYQAFRVLSIYKESLANNTDLRPGDYIYGVVENETVKNVEQLGGYTKALNAIRGEAGTSVTIATVRFDGDSYTLAQYTIERKAFEAESVTYEKDSSGTVGIVKITSFDLPTPHQLRDSILALQDEGINKFVLDLRNNPGGDLVSIVATLSYFLEENDVILSEVDKDGNTNEIYTVQVLNYSASSDYSACNVAKSEIGMFKDLDFVVLCNENTASAAEVFTATVQDYNLAEVVGVTTFGKGIMQSIIPLSYFSSKMTGYVKMTTFGYVTKRGTSYHGIGVVPDEVVELSEEASKTSLYLLEEKDDAQLLKALEIVKN